MIVVRFLVAAVRCVLTPLTRDLNQGRSNILFNGHKGLFHLGGLSTRATQINVGYVACFTWKKRSKLYK